MPNPQHAGSAEQGQVDISPTEPVYMGAMKVRGLRVTAALLLLLVCSGLTALAYASPPDPAWIRGIYDDADYDDVVVLITSTAATIASVFLVDVGPGSLVAGAVVQSVEHPVCSLSSSSLQSRAPPTF